MSANSVDRQGDKMVIGEDVGKTRSFEVPDGRAWRRRFDTTTHENIKLVGYT